MKNECPGRGGGRSAKKRGVAACSQQGRRRIAHDGVAARRVTTLIAAISRTHECHRVTPETAQQFALRFSAPGTITRNSTPEKGHHVPLVPTALHPRLRVHCRGCRFAPRQAERRRDCGWGLHLIDIFCRPVVLAARLILTTSIAVSHPSGAR